MNKKKSMAWEEYRLNEENILKYDSVIFNIKFWSISTFGVLLTIHFTKILISQAGADFLSKSICPLISIVITVSYWLIDYFFKRFQNFSITRNRLLDIFINDYPEKSNYRIPNNLFLYEDLTKHEKEILVSRGFIRKDIGKKIRYKQKFFDFKLLFKLHTCLLYLIQIISSTIILVFAL
jgi:hypothetical protein